MSISAPQRPSLDIPLLAGTWRFKPHAEIPEVSQLGGMDGDVNVQLGAASVLATHNAAPPDPKRCRRQKLGRISMRAFETIILSNYKYLTKQKGLLERKPCVIEFIKLQRECDMITLSTSRHHFTSSKHSQIIN